MKKGKINITDPLETNTYNDTFPCRLLFPVLKIRTLLPIAS